MGGEASRIRVGNVSGEGEQPIGQVVHLSDS